ncbi:MAG: hypothetical protein MI717_10475 [Spirochaetales bacterium]|nr:hypothetical protein [Spirochaetales bacterium]
MFLEIDDGVYINLSNVFHVQWQPYENRGRWVFNASAGEPRSPGPPAARWLPVQSRPFDSREEGEAWLRRALDGDGGLIADPSKTGRRRVWPQDGRIS